MRIRRKSQGKGTVSQVFDFTLFGLNNTPLFEYNSKVMDAGQRKLILSFWKWNSGGFYEVVKDYMKVLDKNGYKLTDEVAEFRENLVEKSK